MTETTQTGTALVTGVDFVTVPASDIEESAAFGQEFRAHTLPITPQVDDVAAAHEQLLAKGVQFVTDVFDSGVCHQAIFLDPAGNSLGLHHRYGPA